MDNKRKIIITALGILAINGIVIVLLLTPTSKLSNIDFYVFDSNDNYHYGVNENLEFIINDTTAVTGRKLLWQMRKGNEVNGKYTMKYAYKSPGNIW